MEILGGKFKANQFTVPKKLVEILVSRGRIELAIYRMWYEPLPMGPYCNTKFQIKFGGTSSYLFSTPVQSISQSSKTCQYQLLYLPMNKKYFKPPSPRRPHQQHSTNTAPTLSEGPTPVPSLCTYLCVVLMIVRSSF